ncbi:MAG TPA: glycoside hydrolase family 3 N-terminal domain-containing protein, partial [Chitinophagaceae bacterium]|nr:glycoside hydrolase family 3 N-terminal domain-containing protein [Chitinophagaceae bacterium]
MKKLFALLFTCSLFSLSSFAQYRSALSEKEWVDSVFRSLSKEEKVAQLMVIRAHSNLGADHVAKVTDQVRRYNVGALCFFQGGPVRQANLTNAYQSIAKTPLMVTIDGEWGLGMRLDSVTRFPYQLTLGALTDESIVYRMGVAVGEQMKRIGVHVNYAPVVDINNNPNNPVIGYRSFGEDKQKVARFGVAYARGMQAAGIMACAKHFPGHGDTEVDSHYDLPVISKSLPQLDSLELYPFKELFKAGVGSVMIAHLAVPAIDKTANRATSVSKNNVTGLLRDELGYEGLTFTDALEMKGVTKFFPAGEASVQALLAGNDMLCLPEDVPAALEAVMAALKKKRLKWKDIDAKVTKVLQAKYRLGLNGPQFVDTTNLLADLNAQTDAFRAQVARNTVTVLSNGANLLPFTGKRKVAYVGLGPAAVNAFGRRLQADYKADTFGLSYKEGADRAAAIAEKIKSGNYDAVIIGVHEFSMRPANNYNISTAALGLWKELQGPNAATFVFGNVYAAKNFCTAPTLVALHQDDPFTQEAAADFLLNRISAKGKLPVTVCQFSYGSGIAVSNLFPVGSSAAWVTIDSIVHGAIRQGAMPGAVVLAVKDGKIRYHKAFGRQTYGPDAHPITLESIYDLASVTKISATTVAVMKLYEEGKLDLEKKLGDYLAWTAGTDKADILVKDLLLHQGGLVPFIPFYKETIDSAGRPLDSLYSRERKPGFLVPVADSLFLRNDWVDTLYQRILKSPLGPSGKYVYSDNDFIFLGKIVEALTGLPLDQYVQKTFYTPLGMTSTGFSARDRFGIPRVVPTEEEKHFRGQLITGHVHDEGASLFGGIAGHAGLFSNAYDLSLLYQMLLNGGTLNGERYLKPETIALFTAYGSPVSRRALGFDKPEKDNATRREPYPSAFASPETFGHTGFTGTCVWADPKENLV